MRPLLDELAEWAGSIRYDTLSPDVRAAARRVLLDQIGLTLAGRRLYGPHPSERLALPAAGGATLWATGVATDPPWAVLINRASADELELVAGPEAGAAVVAAGEMADCTVADVIAGLVVAAGVDDCLRGWMLGPLEQHGLHPPAFAGAAGAAAGAAHVLGATAVETAAAVAGASTLAPQSPGVAFSRGASAKTMYGAWGQMIGLRAACWSRIGMGGSPSVWEGPRGIAAALSDAADITRPTRGPDASAIQRVTFKPYPCSRAGHAALTALEALGPLDSEAIDRIDVATYPYAVTVSQRSTGTTPIAAQVHIPSILALAIVNGGLEPGVAFTPARLADARVRRLVERTHVTVDPALGTGGPRLRRARVRVTLGDSRSLEATREPRWGPGDRASDDQLRDRAGHLVGPDHARRLWTVDPTCSVRALMPLLALEGGSLQKGRDG